MRQDNINLLSEQRFKLDYIMDTLKSKFNSEKLEDEASFLCIVKDKLSDLNESKEK